MDGTLLDSTHTINEKTAQAIQELKQYGIEFMIATGRDFKSASHLLDGLPIQCAMINLNGAMIHDKDGTILYQCEIDTPTIQNLIDYFVKHQLDYSISTTNHHYLSNIETYILKSYERINETRTTTDELTLAQIRAHFADSLDANAINFEQERILKMMIISDDDKKLADCRKFLETFDHLDITSSGAGNLEITHQNAQKGLAILKYIKEKGYQLDEIITIGDSLNDRSMLKMFPNSYAMGNASDEVKNMAANVALSNDHYGVAAVIHSIIDRLNSQPPND